MKQDLGPIRAGIAEGKLASDPDMQTEVEESLVERLVTAAGCVLKTCQSGQVPTFSQLRELSHALYPFTALKRCGHAALEDCACLTAG